MDSGGVFWLCLATFVVGGIVGGGLSRKENKELKELSNRYRVQEEGVIKDYKTDIMYYSDSVVNARVSCIPTNGKWYVPQSIEDAKDIQIIANEIYSNGNHKQVQIMTQFMGVKKNNLAKLIKSGFCSVSSIYEQCERFLLYDGDYAKLEEDDKLLIHYLKGDLNIEWTQAMEACCSFKKPHISTIDLPNGDMDIFIIKH